MEFICAAKSFVDFLNVDMTAEACKANANVGIVVGDKALFITYKSFLNYKLKKNQSLTMSMLMETCRAEGDSLGFSNSLCVVNLLSASTTKDEWLTTVKEQLIEAQHQKVAG